MFAAGIFHVVLGLGRDSLDPTTTNSHAEDLRSIALQPYMAGKLQLSQADS